MVDDNRPTVSDSAQLLDAAVRWATPSPDDPDYEFELLAYCERISHYAVTQGLPAVGSKVANAHGMSWFVHGHTFAVSLQRPDLISQPFDVRNLYPMLALGHVSERLMRLLNQINVCTPKQIVLLDTIPALRKDLALPYNYSTDAFSDPYRILLFIDAENIDEAILAHEVGHLWLQFVDEIEDNRVYRDRDEPLLYDWVQRLQSLVLDFRVNEVLRAKGFDLSSIDQDRLESARNFAEATRRGYRPQTPWEEVLVASVVLELSADYAPRLTLAQCSADLDTIRDALPKVWRLADRLIAALGENPPKTPDSALRCIDEFLIICFAHAGVHLDLEADLQSIDPVVKWHDRWPEWMVGLTPQVKCQVGRAKARADVRPDARMRMSAAQYGTAVSFSDDGERWSEPVVLPFHHAAGPAVFEQFRQIEQLNTAARRYDNMFNNPKSPPGFPGTRNYSSGAARFVSMVRLDQQLAGESPYNYALSNPIRFVDPSGLGPGSGPTSGTPGSNPVCCCSIQSSGLTGDYTPKTPYPDYITLVTFPITVSVGMGNIYSTNGSTNTCKLWYFEKINRPFLDVAPDVWVEITEQVPQRSGQPSWFHGPEYYFQRSQPTGCPSTQSRLFSWTDSGAHIRVATPENFPLKLCRLFILQDGCTGKLSCLLSQMYALVNPTSGFIGAQPPDASPPPLLGNYCGLGAIPTPIDYPGTFVNPCRS